MQEPLWSLPIGNPGVNAILIGLRVWSCDVCFRFRSVCLLSLLGPGCDRQTSLVFCRCVAGLYGQAEQNCTTLWSDICPICLIFQVGVHLICSTLRCQHNPHEPTTLPQSSRQVISFICPDTHTHSHLMCNTQLPMSSTQNSKLWAILHKVAGYFDHWGI